ncbi:MAG: DDE-type integrase/transposase/recombinase [Solirubrobacterales bacterium]
MDGRELKFLNIVDEFTREALEIEVERTIDADETVAVLERLVSERGAPENLRADNGPELTARVLREWCEAGSTDTAYIDPGAPWQNAWGFTEEGERVLVGVSLGCASRTRTGSKLGRDLIARGLPAPMLVVADGAR